MRHIIEVVVSGSLLAAVFLLAGGAVGEMLKRARRSSTLPSPDTFASDVPIEKRHYYGTLTDEERGPVCYLASQLISRPGSSAIWHGTKLEERITIVAPREKPVKVA